jgi:hypothetical protein
MLASVQPGLHLPGTYNHHPYQRVNQGFLNRPSSSSSSSTTALDFLGYPSSVAYKDSILEDPLETDEEEEEEGVLASQQSAQAQDIRQGDMVE